MRARKAVLYALDRESVVRVYDSCIAALPVAPLLGGRGAVTAVLLPVFIFGQTQSPNKQNFIFNSKLYINFGVIFALERDAVRPRLFKRVFIYMWMWNTVSGKIRRGEVI